MLCCTKKPHFYDNDMNIMYSPCKNSVCLTINSNSWSSAQAYTSSLPQGNPGVIWQQHLIIFSLTENHTGKVPKFPSTLTFVNRLACPLQVHKRLLEPKPRSHTWLRLKHGNSPHGPNFSQGQTCAALDPNADSMHGCSLCWLLFCPLSTAINICFLSWPSLLSLRQYCE